MGIVQNIKDYQPTKAALAWTAAGAAVATIAIGFTVGGWVTGGTAQDMANRAAATAHSELAALICVDNFARTETARAQHGELAALSALRQRQFVEGADWAVLPSGESLDRQAATLCASQIVALDPDMLPSPVAGSAEPASAVQ
jgi:hypothetical protein